MAVPSVGIVVVNYNDYDRTIRCVERLSASTYPSNRTRVVVVDNGPERVLASRIRARWPHITVCNNDNVGFGAACNGAFESLRDVDYIALLNNDTQPGSGWLEPLVAALERQRDAGAANPKVLLSRRFVSTEIMVDAERVGRDHRSLGVQLIGVRVDGEDVFETCEFASGFWGPEVGGPHGGHFQWTQHRARLLVPVADLDADASIVLELACTALTKTVRLRGSSVETEVSVGRTPVSVELPRGFRSSEFVNNAGTQVVEDGSVVDREFLEPDREGCAKEREVFGWSGAAVLLRRSFVEDVGGFDDRLFLYYEDACMSWSGRLRGWTYVYVPSSFVHHDHSATSRTVPQLVRHLMIRNRLIVLLVNAPLSVALAAITDFGRLWWRAVRHDIIAAAAIRDRPDLREAVALLRVAAGFARLLPGTLRRRRRQHASAAQRRAVFARGLGLR